MNQSSVDILKGLREPIWKSGKDRIVNCSNCGSEVYLSGGEGLGSTNWYEPVKTDRIKALEEQVAGLMKWNSVTGEKTNEEPKHKKLAVILISERLGKSKGWDDVAESVKKEFLRVIKDTVPDVCTYTELERKVSEM